MTEKGSPDPLGGQTRGWAINPPLPPPQPQTPRGSSNSVYVQAERGLYAGVYRSSTVYKGNCLRKGVMGHGLVVWPMRGMRPLLRATKPEEGAWSQSRERRFHAVAWALVKKKAHNH